MSNAFDTVIDLMRLYAAGQPAFAESLEKHIQHANPKWPRVDFTGFMNDCWENPGVVNWKLLLEKIEQSMHDFQDDPEKLIIVEQDVLEPLSNALVRGEIDPAMIVPHIGPLSKAHIHVIDEGFGGTTPGFEKRPK